ncbi:MAG: hypothetical protein AAFO07_03835 [Bacteroidota bacterium]
MELLNTVGILGRMSSAATGEYYHLINQKVRTIKGGHNIAELIICLRLSIGYYAAKYTLK